MKASPSSSRSVASADRLACVVHGSGSRIYVGIHGWNGTHRTFEPLVARLPDDATFISLDLPGYGQSDPPEEWSLEAVALQILATVEEEVGQTPFTLVGSCSGGIVGLEVASLGGARVERFFFIEPFAYIPDYLGIFLKPVVGRFFYYSAFGNPIGRWITNVALADHRRDDTNMTDSFREASKEVPLRYLHLFDSIERAEDYAHLRCRKELVYGERTFDAIRDSVDTWKSVWPDAIDGQIDDAGHLLLEEAPEEVAQKLFR